MGKGAIPLYSLWNGARLSYVEARMQIYAPIYSAAVEATNAWGRLQKLHEKARREGRTLAIRDFDGHDSLATLGSYEAILYNEEMKMGHGFVLAMMLEGQRVWEAGFDRRKLHRTYVDQRD
jgi:hypothetical protein